MSQRPRKANYWQDAPMPREQLVLIPTALEELIPNDHPVRLIGWWKRCGGKGVVVENVCDTVY